MRGAILILGGILSLFRGPERRQSLFRGPRDRGAAGAGEISGAITGVQDEGIDLATVSKLNFTGAGATAQVSGGVAVVNVPGSADDDYDTWQSRGVAIGQRTTQNAVWPLKAEDNAGGQRTDISAAGYLPSDTRQGYHTHFLDSSAPPGWSVSSPGSAAAYEIAAAGGGLRATCSGASDAIIATTNAVARRSAFADGSLVMRADATVNTTVQAGWFTTAVAAAGTEQGAYFRYQEAGLGTWVCVTRDGAGEKTTDTGLAPATGAGERDHLRIELDSGEVRFYINGVKVATHSANLISTTADLLLGAAQRRTSGTADICVNEGRFGYQTP